MGISMYIKLFGYLIAAGVAFTSLAMYVMGARWQAVEQAGYGGKSRPWWFCLLSAILIGLYVLAVANFVGADKNWATWTLVVFFPVGWVLKGALIVFNAKGRQAVISVEGDQNWHKIAFARLPIAFIICVLAFFA